MAQGFSLSFLGAARTVTGSRYLLDAGTSRIRIAAGLFQGLKDLRLRNWQDLPISQTLGWNDVRTPALGDVVRLE